MVFWKGEGMRIHRLCRKPGQSVHNLGNSRFIDGDRGENSLVVLSLKLGQSEQFQVRI